MATSEGVVWALTGELRIVRRWLRADRLQQEYVATNLTRESDRIAEWRDVRVCNGD